MCIIIITNISKFRNLNLFEYKFTITTKMSDLIPNFFSYVRDGKICDIPKNTTENWLYFLIAHEKDPRKIFNNKNRIHTAFYEI